MKPMKIQRSLSTGKLANALYLTVFIIFVSSVGLTEMVSADTANDKAKKIDASADEALDRFYKQVKDAKFTKLDMSK
jgi:hypothetical protein